MTRFFKTESTASPRKPFTAFEPQAEVFHTKSYNKHGGGMLGNFIMQESIFNPPKSKPKHFTTKGEKSLNPSEGWGKESCQV